MLATSSYTWAPSQTFAPRTPSLLSPRREQADARPRSSFNFMNAQQSSQTSKTTNIPFSSRPIKPGLPCQSRDAVAERRRTLFLNKVRQERDDKRWEARSDQLARLDYMNEKRQWEADKTRSAPPGYTDEPDEEDLDGPGGSSGLPGYSSQMHLSHSMSGDQSFAPALEEEQVDEVLQCENEELEALISMLEEEQRQQNQERQPEGHSQDDISGFGSDDEVYDSIFMDIEDDSGSVQPQQQVQGAEGMDMSG